MSPLNRERARGLSGVAVPAHHRSGNSRHDTAESGEGAKTRPDEEDDVKEYERKQLLERVEREAATVGADIPDEIEVQGETLELSSFVFEIKRRDTVPEGERERVQEAKKNLRRERLQRYQRLEDDEDLTYDEGETLANSIIGIDRALNALEQLRPVDLETEAQRQETVDQKRWMNFLKQALGHEDAGGDPGRSSL